MFLFKSFHFDFVFRFMFIFLLHRLHKFLVVSDFKKFLADFTSSGQSNGIGEHSSFSTSFFFLTTSTFSCMACVCVVVVFWIFSASSRFGFGSVCALLAMLLQLAKEKFSSLADFTRITRQLLLSVEELLPLAAVGRFPSSWLSPSIFCCHLYQCLQLFSLHLPALCASGRSFYLDR